jgi:hypothetical protein
MAIKTRKKRSKKRVAFYKLRAILEKQEIDNKRKEELIAFIDNELYLLEKKNCGYRKPRVTQRTIENEEFLRPQIASYLYYYPGATPTEIANGIELQVTTERVTKMLYKMAEDGDVLYYVYKRKPRFSLS